MEDRLAFISLIISNPDSVATVNEKFHLQSSLIIARLGVPCREYGVSVLRDPGQEQLGQANLLLTFGKTAPCGTAGSLWLPCGEVTEADGFENAAPAVRYGAPPEVEEALRVDCNRNALLSILLEMGALRANELEVMEILQNA